MSLLPLVPQLFGTTAQTQLPALSMYDSAYSQLPSVYQNAPNFIGVLQAISAQKQYLYDVIRSLINSYNLNDSLGSNNTDSATPTGIYLKMVASVFNAQYFPDSTDATILNLTQNITNFVNSRGRPHDFFNYFDINGIGAYFTNLNVNEDGNATIYFNVPIADIVNPQSTVQIQLTVTALAGAGPYTIPTGWQATGYSTTAPYLTINDYTINATGIYYLTLYSTDITTNVPAAGFTNGTAVAGLTFTVTNPSPSAVVSTNPYNVFVSNMLKLKAAGIKVVVNTFHIPFFQYGSLTDPPQVAPGNAGFGILQNNGKTINGGFFGSL